MQTGQKQKSFVNKKFEGKSGKKGKPKGSAPKPKMIDVKNRAGEVVDSVRFPRKLDDLHALLDRFDEHEYEFNRIQVVRGYWMRRHKAVKTFMPLQVGVHEALLNDAKRSNGETPDLYIFKQALRLHTTSPTYCANVLSKKRRFKLDGSQDEMLDLSAKLYHANLLQSAIESAAGQPNRFKPVKPEYVAVLEKFKKFHGDKMANGAEL